MTPKEKEQRPSENGDLLPHNEYRSADTNSQDNGKKIVGIDKGLREQEIENIIFPTSKTPAEK